MFAKRLNSFMWNLYCSRTSIEKFSSAISKIPTVYYEEIKNLHKHPEKLLIDVRDPSELNFGKIPQAINIPLCDLEKELAIDNCTQNPETFRRKHGRDKPNANTYIITYCKSGQRSEIAAEIVCNLGYKNVHNYSGSWLDYVQHQCNS